MPQFVCWVLCKLFSGIVNPPTHNSKSESIMKNMSLKIRYQADDFFRSYEVLKADFQSNFEKQATPTAGYTMTPCVVNLAFAVELYLKDLYQALGIKAPRVHEILKLYKKLPDQTRTDIYNHPAINENPFATQGSIFEPNRIPGTSQGYDGFLHHIETMNKAFVEWRYSYDKGSLNYEEWFALAFIEAIKATADKARNATIYQHRRDQYFEMKL